MFKRSLITVSILCSTAAFATPAAAQSDVSPVLLLESVPSDNPNYRRMVYVKYLTGDRANVIYKAYNRSEFIQVSGGVVSEANTACARGAATSFKQIRAYERAEARRKRNGQPTEATSFCVKNVSGWESKGNRKKFLDPIFNGMPYAATRR